MKKLLPRLLALLLVITMLPISAFATLQNHNVSDVTIVQSDTESNYYFPDIVMLPDGRLIACYYQATTHVASNSYGVIYLAESTDNGYHWSEPWKVVDRTSEPKDTRDPNLAVLPNGTLVLTYFIGAGGSGTFMLFSEDGGRTWSEHIQLESEILDQGFGKRGTIAVINDENMLIPVYGTGSGNNSYGAPATATGKGQFSSYHRDAVMLHYQLVDGEWTLVYESLIGQEIDETALLYTGEGIVDGTTYDGDVWSFSREDGTVRVTRDCGRTWEVMAKEEPRQWTTSGTIMSAEQIIQPRFVQIAKNCWFATYASYTVFNYAYDKQVRPVYGKIFFPEAGWYATQSKLIYDEQTFGVSDMADPATVLTAEGRLLTIYYNTGTKSIAGTFSDLSDWVDLDADSLGTETAERPFWDGAFSSMENVQSVFNLSANDWSWAASGVVLTGDAYSDGNDGVPSFTSKETISGDYSVQFDFTLRGESTEVANDWGENDRDEGIQVFPLHESTNSNITGGKQYRVRLSTTHGVSLHYGSNNKGDYSDTLAGMQNTTNIGTHSLPTTLNSDTTYTAEIAKIGDGLYIKVWEKGTEEPDWQCEYHHETIDAEDEDTEFKFKLSYVNKVYNRDKNDTENVLLSNMSFAKLTYEEWNYDGKLTKSTHSANTTNNSGFNESLHNVKWNTDSNGFAIWHGSSTVGSLAISGDYNFSTEFTFQRETVATGDNWKANGMTVFPQYKGYGGDSLASHRINLSTHSGLQMSYSNSWWPGSNGGGVLSAGENIVVNNDNTSFTVGKTYILEYQKTGNKLYVKAYEKGTTDTNGWDYVITSNELGTNYPCMFFYYDNNSASATEATAFKMDNIDINGYSTVETAFWGEPFSSEEAAAEVFDVHEYSNWFIADTTKWPVAGLASASTAYEYCAISGKTAISGDYSAEIDFKLAGTKTDALNSEADRDGGLHILPMDPMGDPAIDPAIAKVLQYRIRLSQNQGVQLTYTTNRASDYGTVVAGVRSSNTDHTLPASLKRDTIYTLKYQKIADTLYIKVWEKGTTEPTDWQCVYSDDTIDVEGEYYFGLHHFNKGTDDEYGILSNASFSQILPVTTVNEVGYKEEAKWTFATLSDGNIISSGKWNISGNNASISGVRSASLYNSENISGNYDASFRFTLSGNAEGSQDGLWIYPLYETTNTVANRGTHKIRLSASEGIQAFFREDYAASTDVEITGVQTENAVTSLQAGTEYAVRVSKAYDTLSVKVWPANEAEPLGWDLVWRDESIGSMVYYEAGSYSYPYDFSRYGDLDASGNPYQWTFHLNYKDAQTAGGIAISDLELCKYVTMELNYTQLTVNEGEKPLNVEMNTTFYPNIFAQLPTPEGCVEYTTERGNVETTALIHTPGVRIQRANVTGVSAGDDKIIASYPGIVDSEGNVVEVTCEVTVRSAVDSNEFKGIDEGYVSEVLYEEDFEDVDVFENATVNETDKTYTIEDASYNPMSEFFDHAPFYAMAHNAVLETEEGDNRYLKTYSGSGSSYAGVQFQSKEKLTGDYTFQADVYLGSGSAEFRLNLSDHKGWSQPSGEGAAVRTFGSNMTSLEKMDYANYQFGFRQWMTRGRLNSSVGIYLYDETEQAKGWQTVKAVKAGDTVYFKSWAKGTPEPDWEVIFIDPKIAAADEAFGGAYLTIDFDANYTNKDKYSTSGEILMDNVRITRQVEIDDSTEVYNVTLDLGGATLADGKDITQYAAGSIVDLPIAEDMAKEGYIFEGWYTDSNFSGEPVTTIGSDAEGDLTLYAKWVKDENYLDTDNLGPVVGGDDEPAVEPTVDFKDVPANAWYHEAVEYAVLNGLMNGISETEFAPNNTLNRAMVVTVLWRMEGEPAVSYDMSFTDVPTGQWYTEAVRWAASEGIVNGMDAQTYAPLNAVTREQLVTILYRYAQKKGYDVSVGEDTNILSYTDAFDIAEYAIPAMQWACGAGVINGNDDGSLNPKGNTKRSEFAKVIMNFCENVAE